MNVTFPQSGIAHADGEGMYILNLVLGYQQKG